MRKIFKKIITTTLTASMLLSMTSPVMADTDQDTSTVKAEFKDVDERVFYYTPVYWAKLNGITFGTSEVTFSPDQPCTRGQMAAFIWRVNGSPEPKKSNYFQDVSPESSFAKAIAWVKEQGITVGTSDTTYSPDQPCTRGQMAAFLWRLSGSPEPEKQDYFADVSESSPFADAIAWAKENGITNGTTDMTYSPDQPCTRGQMTTFLWKQSDAPSVKILKWVVDKPAWDETVVDKEAYDEQVKIKDAYDEQIVKEQPIYHCNGCGQIFYSAETLHAHRDAAIAANSDSQCGTFWAEYKQVPTTVHHDAVYQTVHHDAVTHVVHHDATYHWA